MKELNLDFEIIASVITSVTVKVILDMLIKDEDEKDAFMDAKEHEFMSIISDISNHTLSMLTKDSNMNDAQKAIILAFKEEELSETIKELDKMLHQDSEPSITDLITEVHDCDHCDIVDTCKIKDAVQRMKALKDKNQVKGTAFGMASDKDDKLIFDIKNSFN